jgi:hypothetical protein
LKAALHSVGDVLGLTHSRDPDAIMSPFYKQPLDRNGEYVSPRLHINDINAAKDLYGKSSSSVFEMDRSRGCRERGDCQTGGDVRDRTSTPRSFTLNPRGSKGNTSSQIVFSKFLTKIWLPTPGVIFSNKKKYFPLLGYLGKCFPCLKKFFKNFKISRDHNRIP